MSTESSRELPEHPHLDHLRGQAKALLRAVRGRDPEAVARVQSYADPAQLKLAGAQLVVARQYGFASWRALVEHVNAARALLVATQGGDAAAMRGLLAAHPQLVDARTSRERALPTDAQAMRLLHVCVAGDHAEAAQVLLEHGADVNARNADGRTPLHDALELSRGRLRDVLLGAGADVDVCSAALMGDVERLRAILDDDPRRAFDATTGLPPLGWASYGGDPASLAVLLEYGVEPEAFDALVPAAECGHARFVAAALAAGSDATARVGKLGRTPLHAAAQLLHTNDATKAARLLIEAGASPHTPDNNGDTPLDLARRAAQDARADQRFDRMLALLEPG